jgi:hypothetical protein
MGLLGDAAIATVIIGGAIVLVGLFEFDYLIRGFFFWWGAAQRAS